MEEIDIPAGETEYRLMGELTRGCSEKMGPDSVQIVGVTFHMHKYGTRQFLEHWRGGERLPDIARQSWDFNFQTGQNFPPERWVEFKRGDELRCNCVYDTTAATENIKGGDGSDDEMCLCFVKSFPPMDVQISMQMEKTYKMVGMENRVMCIANTGDRSGLGASNYFAQQPGNVFEKLATFSEEKSIPEVRVEQLPGPQPACVEADLHEAHKLLPTAYGAAPRVASTLASGIAVAALLLCRL